MKFLKLNTMCLIFIVFLLKSNAWANDNKIYASFTANNLTIKSYSKSWTKNMLKDLYIELLNNFHGEEFNYLNNIYIYPDAPEGVNGLYFDDIYINNDGYKLGNNAYINLYNGDKLNTIQKMAYTLSHEYGHHYIIYNLMKTENVYYHNLTNSKYVKIRNLDNKPTIYDSNKQNYVYHWDIMEIMADDYVQLLGSSNARMSYDYKSVDELLKNSKLPYENPYSFNLKPQLNPYIPLAADVPGLYNYLVNIGGFTVSIPKIPNKPKLGEVTGYIGVNNEPTYNVTWDNPNENDVLEYTLVIYPDNNPFVAYPLKTLTSKEPLNVTFGSYSIKQNDNSIKQISQKYEGNYTLKLYIKDSLGFIHSSEPKTYNFTQINKDIISNNKKQKNVPSKSTNEANKGKNETNKKKNEAVKPKNETNKPIKPISKPPNKFIGPILGGSIGDIFNLI